MMITEYIKKVMKMSLPPKPRIHDVVQILIIHDFIFESRNIPKYYKMMEPFLDKKNQEKRLHLLPKIQYDLANMIREEILNDLYERGILK